MSSTGLRGIIPAMTLKTALTTVLVLACCLPLAWGQSSEKKASRQHLKPGIFHLGSFESELAGRFSMAEGTDSGSVVLQWSDGLTGQLIQAERADLGVGPSLNVRWTSSLGEQKLVGYGLAGALSNDNDKRLIMSQQIEVRNDSDVEQRAQVVAKLFPGGNDASLRPFPSKPFRDGEVWSLVDERFLLRDGYTVASWIGDAPSVEVIAHPDSGDTAAARLTWNFVVQPGKSHWLEVMMAGPAATADVDDAAWRARFRRKSYGSLEDIRRWESMFHGEFGAFTCADERVREVMVTSIHILRSLGQALYGAGPLSDRGFGHPASDAAAEAQILGTFLESGLNEIAQDYVETLLAEVYERAGSLTLDRKVAYLHGLARGIRLAGDASRHPALALAILDLANGGGPEGWSEPWNDGDVAVAPWFDPADVRGDLGQILSRAGMGTVDDVPLLAWAQDVDPASAAGEMLASCRALSEGDADTAWVSLSQLLSRSTRVGLGSMTPGGPAQGAYALGMSAIIRSFLVNDHGKDLLLFPGNSDKMMGLGVNVQTAWLPTAFGQLKAQAYFTGKAMLGGWVTLRSANPPQRCVLQFPSNEILRKIKVQHGEGSLEVISPTEVLMGLLPGRSLRFNVTIKHGGMGKADG
ncbi:MAG: hypothetical protein ACI9EF_000656 [Pseudohongiellaceae bacterium]|jgi:hypothetical protein